MTEISQPSRLSVAVRALAEDVLGAIGTTYLFWLVVIQGVAPLEARIVAGVAALGTAFSAVVMIEDYWHHRLDPDRRQTVRPLPFA